MLTPLFLKSFLNGEFMAQKNPIVVGDGTHTELVSQINNFEFERLRWPVVVHLVIGGLGMGIGSLGMGSMMSGGTSSILWGMIGGGIVMGAFLFCTSVHIFDQAHQAQEESLQRMMTELRAKDPSLEGILNQIEQQFDHATQEWLYHVERVLKSHVVAPAIEVECDEQTPAPQKVVKGVTI